MYRWVAVMILAVRVQVCAESVVGVAIGKAVCERVWGSARR